MSSYQASRNRAMGISLLLFIAISTAQSQHNTKQLRWSRQINSYDDLSDWVPLAQPLTREYDKPIKRQAVAQPRILAEPVTLTRAPFVLDGRFPPQDNRLLYLQSVPTAPQNYLNDQTGFNPTGYGQNFKPQTQPHFPLQSNQNLRAQPAFESSFTRNEKKQSKPLTMSSNYMQFLKHVPQSALSQSRPFGMPQKPPPRPDTTRFIDGYKQENTTKYNEKEFTKARPQSLQKIKFDNPNYNQRKELISEMVPPPKPAIDKEEVQLLYVPIESLNKGMFNYKTSPNSKRYTAPTAYGGTQILSPSFHTNSYQQSYHQPTFQAITQDLVQSPFRGRENIERIPNFASVSQPTEASSIKPSTQKAKKLKPHQPPLAIFVTPDSGKPESIKVSDVLSSLKNAQTVAVLDSVSPSNSPKVFIGPSALNPPQNYVKFEIPYLSNIQDSERRINQLPFFVAPLSYNTPEGFAKIPFPSPHVGSIVVNSHVNDGLKPVDPTPSLEVIPNSFTAGAYNQHPYTPTTKPTFSYFSTVSSEPTSPITQKPYNTFYSFEKQNVAPLKTTNDDFITAPPSYSPDNFQYGNLQTGNHFDQMIYQTSSVPSSNREASTLPPQVTRPRVTQKTTVTLPSKLLETHNPFSINQAFQFSSPMESFSTGHDDISSIIYSTQTPQQNSVSTTATEKTRTKPAISDYYPGLQYQPEIQYPSDAISSKYPEYNSNNYESLVTTHQQKDAVSQPVENSQGDQSQSIEATPLPNSYSEDDYKSSETSQEIPKTSASTTSTTTPTTTTTTKRPVRRTRTRTTTLKPETSDEITKQTYTKRPLRERKPIPPRSRYEGVKATEKTTSIRKQPETTVSSTESTTTRIIRTRTRPRGQYKPSHNREESVVENKIISAKKVDDLAYQRDVLHQNYPVTLQERVSTVDIDAFTTPTPRQASSHFPSRDENSEDNAEEDNPPSFKPLPSRYPDEFKQPITSEPPKHSSVRDNFEDRSNEAITPAPKQESTHNSRGETDFTSVPRFSSTSKRIEHDTDYKADIADFTSATKITEAPRQDYSSRGETEYTSSSKLPSTPKQDFSYYDNVDPEPSTAPKISSTSPRLSSRYSADGLNNMKDAYTSPPRQSTKFSSRDESDDFSNQPITSPPRSTISRYTERDEKPTSPSQAVTPTPTRQTSIRYSSRDEVSEQYDQDLNSGDTESSDKDSRKPYISRFPVKRLPEKETFENQYSESDISDEKLHHDTVKVNKVDNMLNVATISETSVNSKETAHEKYESEELPTTSPPNNKIRVRPRPALLRTTTTTTRKPTQSTEAPKRASTRKPIRPVTYRPGFSGKRTTMRIDEIESEFKTKQIKIRDEVKPDSESRPVYKPEPSSEAPASTPSAETSTLRKLPSYRRRRPGYSSPTSESSSSAAIPKKSFDTTKNRYRSRTSPTTSTTSTARPNLLEETVASSTKISTFDRYRKRLPNERFRPRTTTTTPASEKTPEDDKNDQEDQDTNYTFLSHDFVPLEYEFNEADRRVLRPVADSGNVFKTDNKHEFSSLASWNSASEIITAGYDGDNILLSVTPASNKLNEVSTVQTDEQMSIEDVIDEAMRDLEKQDEREYVTERKQKNENDDIVKPYEIVNEDSHSPSLQNLKNSVKEPQINAISQIKLDVGRESAAKRRGIGKRRRTTSTESIAVAESQFYSNTVNHLGDEIKPSAVIRDQEIRNTQTTPKYIETTENESTKEPTTNYAEYTDLTSLRSVETTPLAGSTEKNANKPDAMKATTYHPAPIINKEILHITTESDKQTLNPADMDLGTGAPDPTIMEKLYSEENDDASESSGFLNDSLKSLDRVMAYILDESTETTTKEAPVETERPEEFTVRSVVTEISKAKRPTTEASSYFPEEITNSSVVDEDILAQEMIEEQMRGIQKISDIKVEISPPNASTQRPTIIETTPNQLDTDDETMEKVEAMETQKREIVLEATSESNPWSKMSSVTSMTSEVSEETEICFRGKCIKTRNLLV